MLKAGLSEVNITPLLNQTMPGQFHMRWGQRILDELYVKALVLENGGVRAAIVAVDTISLDDTQYETFRSAVKERTGISNIMFAATHTHSGGPIQSWNDYYKNDAYERLVLDKCVDAAAIAVENLQPATLRVCREHEDGIAFNRRFYMKDGSLKTNPGVKNPDVVKAAGPIDPDVTVVRIDDINGNIIGMLTNFSCHLDVLGGDEISADYPGELSRVLKSVYGGHIVSVFLTAPCGNINHIDISGAFATPVGHYKRMGKVLAGKVIAAAEKSYPMQNADISVAYNTIECAVRQPSKEDAEKGRAYAAAEKRANLELYKVNDGSLQDLFYAKEAVRMYENPEPTAKLEIMALGLGDLAIVTAPAELFVEFSLDIKSSRAFPYIMVSSLTNGMVGYVVTKDALETGGYESRLCGSAKMSDDTGYMLADAAKKLLKELPHN